MDARKFSELREIEKLDMTGLKVGDKFLFGNKMCEQKEMKSVGQYITFYEVIKIDKHGYVEYTPRYEKLEGY